jgi:hypothetical protein
MKSNFKTNTPRKCKCGKPRIKIKIGKNACKNKRNDYCGDTGIIEWCGRCCKKNRIQFDGIGNNELLSNFNILKCKIYYE